MTVKLTVSDVRRRIWFAAGSNGSGERATKLLGQIFHELFAQLVGADSGSHVDRILEDAKPDLQTWNALVLDQAYREVIFPRIQANRHVMPEMSAELLTFWDAVRAMCRWLCELRWTWTEGGQKSLPRESWILPEQPLSMRLSPPEWSGPVELTGIVDALIRRPDGAWCVVELKLGQTAPEADLAQACLYHFMQLSQDAPSACPGTAMALVQFTPEKQETLYSALDLASAQRTLIDVLGEMTGLAETTLGTSPSPGITSPVSSEMPVASGVPFGNASNRPRPAVPPASAGTQKLGERIVAAFAQYQAALEIDGEPIVGPAFVRFPLRLGRGVRVKKIEGLSKDIKVALGLEAAPFIHDADGQMVIDVQRPDRQPVLFDQVLDQFPRLNPQHGSPKVPIGVDLNGELAFLDFSDSASPHVLVAGTNGSGKSEWLISAIAGMNRLNTPQTLRYVLIDPKRNAFTWMKDSEYLLKPVVFPGETNVVEVFESLVEEMQQRYRLFEGDSNLQSYVTRTGKMLPRIICICDEFFDLLAGNAGTKKEIEELISRLGSKARAAGIHLILATQQPSRRVISGVLDTNIPARVGLRTSKVLESQMLLGESGAENLLGNGDLLFKSIGPPKRFQGIYLPENQRAKYARPRAVDKVIR